MTRPSWRFQEPRWLWLCGAASERPHAVRGATGFFCSLFDSNEARQTVRWGRFLSLLFAPEKRAAGVKSRSAKRHNCCRLNFVAGLFCNSTAAVWLQLCSRAGFDAARGFCKGPHIERAAISSFHSCFDSNKTSKTVRWGVLGGIEFTLKKRAKRASPALCWPRQRTLGRA